jgi:hypothetical protein
VLDSCDANLFCDENTHTCRQLTSKPAEDLATSGLHCDSGHAFKGRCLPPTELTSKEYLSTREMVEEACVYNDGHKEDALCMEYSMFKDITAHCRKYDLSYKARLFDLKRYILSYPRGACILSDLFCDRATTLVGQCNTRKALEALYANELREEDYITTTCWVRPIQSFVFQYRC